jgi:hypothetical protein
LGVDPELLSHLVFCSCCKGYDCQWTDWTMSEIDDPTIEDSQEYRAYLSDSMCKDRSSFPKSCTLNKGISHEAMILQIVEHGLMRTLTATRPLNCFYYNSAYGYHLIP